MTREQPSAKMPKGSISKNPYTSYVHSRITVYHASKIDLRYCRSLHSCTTCKLGHVEDPCGAIHFGICAAILPSTKLRRRPITHPFSTVARQAGSTGDHGNVYYKDINYASPVNTRKTRSLSILREGHELAGAPLDITGLFRLHPQRQDNDANRGGEHKWKSNYSKDMSGESRAHDGQGRGMTAAISPNQTNIASERNTDIQILSQDNEIRIRRMGEQNTRVHPVVSAGERTGHVTAVHGKSDQGYMQYPEKGAVRPISGPLSFDVVDFSHGPSLPVTRNLSSMKQPLSQKPTARVAPAPISTLVSVLTTAPAPLQSPPSATIPSPTTALFPHFPEAPMFVRSAPPITDSSFNDPFHSASHLSTPPLASQSSSPPSVVWPSRIATVSPTKQPVLAVNKDGNNAGKQVRMVSPHATRQDNTTVKNRRENGVKDSEELLFLQDKELHYNNYNLHGTGSQISTQQQALQEPLPASRIFDKISIPTSDSKLKTPSSRSYSHVHIPQFHFPSGKPDTELDVEVILQAVAVEFNHLKSGKAYKEHIGKITKACGFPLYWKILLFRAAGGKDDNFVTYQSLSVFLRKLFQTCHDEASKFMRLTANSGENVLEFEDFDPLVQDIIETHPGLTFLQDAADFHSRYVTTVISRIMYCVNRSWTGRITVPELRKSNLLQTIVRLELEDDINQIQDFFSYEHFYVIYCKFWELDKDHDLFIDRIDLSEYNDYALSSRIVDRIFSGAVTRGSEFQAGRMSYKEFVWFLLAEVDKKHPTSIEYWFRCMDLDGDGVISMYEMEYFHEEQMIKIEALGIERLPFEDTVCQMMDMVSPKVKGKITLGDLKACKMTDIFFDTFFNLDKFLEHEQKDPFANARDPNVESVEDNEWNRYADEEYDILVADDMQVDLNHGSYDGNYELDDGNLAQEEFL